MSFSSSTALDIIRNALSLLKEESVIFASSEDAAYFRSKAKQTKFPSSSKTSPIEKTKEPSSPLVKINQEKEALPKKKSSTLSNHFSTALPSQQFCSILEKIAPELTIVEEIPDDTIAKQLANRWKTKAQAAPLSILSGGELPQHHKIFLGEIATALDVCFGSAKLIEADLIEKEKQWKLFLSTETLKLIILCDSTLWQLVSLRQFYKETPANESRILGNTPLFLLPDLSLYLKDPSLKRSLWKTLCSKCS